MSVRIRYEHTEIPEVVVSVRVFLANNLSYRVKLNTSSLEYFVEDIANCVVAASGTAPSLSKLKIKAKNELQKLGVQFSEESRSRSTSV